MCPGLRPHRCSAAKRLETVAIEWQDVQPWAAPAVSFLSLLVSGLTLRTVLQERAASFRASLYTARHEIVKNTSLVAVKIAPAIEDRGWALKARESYRDNEEGIQRAEETRKALFEIHDLARSYYIHVAAIMPAEFVRAYRKFGLLALRAATSNSSERTWDVSAQVEEAWEELVREARAALHVDVLDPKIIRALGERPPQTAPETEQEG
jgi:hypothetical protein